LKPPDPIPLRQDDHTQKSCRGCPMRPGPDAERRRGIASITTDNPQVIRRGLRLPHGCRPVGYSPQKFATGTSNRSRQCVCRTLRLTPTTTRPEAKGSAQVTKPNSIPPISHALSRPSLSHIPVDHSRTYFALELPERAVSAAIGVRWIVIAWGYERMENQCGNESRPYPWRFAFKTGVSRY
jgi:hypothetical protein